MDIDIGAMLLEGFLNQNEDYQKESVMLASNARFVLRMTEGAENTTEVGKSVNIIRDALIRGISSLGGKLNAM